MKFNDILQRLLQEMDLAIKDLEQLSGMIDSVSTLQSDALRLRAVRDATFVAIQSAIDIGIRIISQMQWPKPENYRQVFQILQDKGLLTPEQGADMMDLAGFRNVLIHLYWRLQLDRLFKFLKEDHKRIIEFRKAILQWMAQQT